MTADDVKPRAGAGAARCPAGPALHARPALRAMTIARTGRILIGGSAPDRQEGVTMHARARIAGHAVHPMLIVFPLGLLATSFLFDVVRIATGAPSFATASFYMIAAGVVGGLVAAAFGLADWLAVPVHTRARRVGAIHGIGNVVVVVLFVLSWGMRYADPADPGAAPVIVSLLGVLLALVTGWLGGELVERLSVGVDEGAHLDSTSSLSGRPATERWTPTRPLQPRKA